MELNTKMRIEVSTTLVTSAVAADRPAYLPAAAEWPVPDGLRIMYSFGSRSDHCVCSGCITDDDIVSYTADYYGESTTSLTQVAKADNLYWTCNTRRRRDGRPNCSKAGSTLP
jgi:hypothetical protein